MLGAFALVAMSMGGEAPAEPHHAHEAPRLGQIAFESSCAAAAKPSILRALGWLHSFEYDEAEREFAAAAAADPACAIAYWGVAKTQYHPLWAPPSTAELAKGRAALARAKSAGAPTPLERAFIDALDVFYQSSASSDHRARVLAYASAMEQLRRAYPADREAAIFAALALIAAGTLDEDPTYGQERAAATILHRVFKAAPDHPGVAHYLIHGYDYPALAHLALPAARRYAGIAPASAHAQHMPSHIFVRLGLWDEAIASNRAAEAAALAYAKARAMPGAWDERLHAMDYLIYGHLQQSDDNAARRMLDELYRIERVDPPNFKVAYAVTAMPARFALERQQWVEAASLALPDRTRALVSWPRFRWAEAHIHLARAIGSARLKDSASARTALSRLIEIEAGLPTAPGDYDWRRQVSIQRQTAEAWVLFAESKGSDALAIMRAAADLDDKTEKHPVTPGSIAPAREQLGEMLLENGQPAEAAAAFRTALKHAPNRRVALAGLARATRRSQ